MKTQRKTLFRIWDKLKQEYITVGYYNKKHTWFTFPALAIGTHPRLYEEVVYDIHESDKDRYEVHEFSIEPCRKYNLKKQLL